MGQSLQPEPSGERSDGRKPAELAEKGSALEQGLCVIVDSFYRYAKGPPGAKALDQAAFQHLLRNELSRQLTNTEVQEAVARIFAKLDANQDQRISFEEYWQLITWICQVIRHRDYEQQ
ncbi:protein S100-A16-like [Emydura macquarii macquarii]|uniref:protein S100-A16-like n=1 Tax=Emydura macquarii macquarii TaxID=1129001 RepID=UPI00352AAE5F